MDQEDSEHEYYLLGTGTWRDWLPKMPRPALALGHKILYSVMIHGEGFVLDFGPGSPMVGFYTTRFVAARNRLDAEATAINRVAADWASRGYEDSQGRAEFSVHKASAMDERFRLRNGTGFCFYSESDEDSS